MSFFFILAWHDESSGDRGESMYFIIFNIIFILIYARFTSIIFIFYMNFLGGLFGGSEFIIILKLIDTIARRKQDRQVMGFSRVSKLFP